MTYIQYLVGMTINRAKNVSQVPKYGFSIVAIKLTERNNIIVTAFAKGLPHTSSLPTSDNLYIPFRDLPYEVYENKKNLGDD